MTPNKIFEEEINEPSWEGEIQKRSLLSSTTEDNFATDENKRA